MNIFLRYTGLFWACLICLWSAVSAQDETPTPTAAPTAANTEAPVTPAPTALGWQGCEDFDAGKKLVTIGEKTTVCLTIADGLDWSTQRTYMRVNFQPIADEYSRFLVPNSFKELVDETGTPVANLFQGKHIAVHASSQTALSYQKQYFDSSGKVYPFLTAVIDVQDGVVQGIAWDDASIFCGPKKADRNTFDYDGIAGSENRFGQPVKGCYLELDECRSDSGENTACDLVLYVVWTGTDATGRSFLSSSYRNSAFPAQDWADRFTRNLPEFPELPELPKFPNSNEDN